MEDQNHGGGCRSPDMPQSAESASINDVAARDSRRHTDQIIVQLVGDVSALKGQMIENTIVTKEVRDILSTFKMVGAFAKWFCTITAAVAAAYSAAKGLRG